MLNITSASKQKYIEDSSLKEMTILFPGLGITLSNSDIVYESAELIESINEGENFQFIGCISSQFKATITNVSDDIKGEEIIVTIVADETETIPYFSGIVVDIEQDGANTHKKITCYDVLYTFANTDVSAWYKNLSYPISLRDFRDGLFALLGVSQVTTTLVNDTIRFERNYNPASISALELLKHICQINGVFGIINRSGQFEYKSASSGVTQELGYYKNIAYQEYMVKPVDKLVIRCGDQPEDIVSGGGENEYVVSNNIFCTNMSRETLQGIANRLYPKVSGFSYIPFESDTNGLPYVECLDKITIPVKDLETGQFTNVTFTVVSRTLKGIQNLRDICYAEGDEYQHIFTSDIGTDMEELKRVVENLQNDIDNLQMRYYLVTNTADIHIADGERENIIDLRFAANKGTIVVFHAEIPCEVETTVDGNTFNDAVCKMTYYMDNEEITDYHPTETFVDGEHIIHLLRYFTIQDSALRRLRVFVDMDGGDIYVKTANLSGGIYGQNLVATDNWNGVLDITETAGSFAVIETSMLGAVDTVTCTPQVPTGVTISEIAGSFAVIETTMIDAVDNLLITTHVDSEQILTEDGEEWITESGEAIYTEGT